MINGLYQALYQAINSTLAGLQLFNLSPQPANLVDIVTNDKIQNPSITLVQQKQQTNLESFLDAVYEIIGKYDVGIVEGSSKPQVEIQYYNIKMVSIMEKGVFKFLRVPYLDSVINYETAIDSNGKKIHLISYFKAHYESGFNPDFKPQYLIVLPDGENTATVIEREGKFDENDLKEKITNYLEKQEKAKKKKSL